MVHIPKKCPASPLEDMAQGLGACSPSSKWTMGSPVSQDSVFMREPACPSGSWGSSGTWGLVGSSLGTGGRGGGSRPCRWVGFGKAERTFQHRGNSIPKEPFTGEAHPRPPTEAFRTLLWGRQLGGKLNRINTPYTNKFIIACNCKNLQKTPQCHLQHISLMH